MAESIGESRIKFLVDCLKELTLEVNEHRRTNHLHREGLGQAFRIHEAETIAAQEYHRKEVNQSNDQHAREIFQARVMHEEDIDLEKRGAIRENLRDEWLQLSDKAETMFIVNTLVLGSSFMMLIEGSLPESVTLEMHTVMVSYSCALSAAICLLLFSVRFAMILRFRVGRLIVEEMRIAIGETAKRDKEFRNMSCYRKCNRPKRSTPACDDPRTAFKVQPYSAQVSKAGGSRSSRGHQAYAAGTCDGHDADDEGASPAFISRPAKQTLEKYPDLKWLNEGSGFAVEHMLAPICPQRHRARIFGRTSRGVVSSGDNEAIGSDTGRATFEAQPNLNAQPIGNSCSSSPWRDFDPTLPSSQGLLTAAGESGRLSNFSQESYGSDFSGPSMSASAAAADDVAGDAGMESFGSGHTGSDEPDPSPPGPDLHGTEAEFYPLGGDGTLEKFEREYRAQLKWRMDNNRELEDRLNKLRTKWCKPWDRMAQLLFFSGTLALLFASCCLVFCRFGYQQVSIPEGAYSFPAAPLAAAGFCTPVAVTLLLMVYNERPLWIFANLTDELYQPDGEGDRKVIEKEVWSAWPFPGRAPALLRGLFESDCEIHPRIVTLVMLLAMSMNFLGFLLADALSDKLLNFGQPGDTARASSGVLRQADGSRRAFSNALALTALPITRGGEWPAFWEPVGAAWWPTRQVLLLAGGSQLLELSLDSDGFVVPGHVHHVADGTMLADVCITSDSKGGDDLWLASDSPTFSLHVATAHGGSVLQQVSMLNAGDLFGLPSAETAEGAATRAITCRGGVGAGSTVQLWLAANEASWPVLVGADVLRHDPGFHASGASTEGTGTTARWLGAGLRWPTAWLLVDANLTAALLEENHRSQMVPRAIEVEDLEVLGDELLILVTSISESSAVLRGARQVLALVDASGQLRWWRFLQPPGEKTSPGATEPAASHLLGRWQAMSADAVKRRVFFVSGGPEPHVAVARLPE